MNASSVPVAGSPASSHDVTTWPPEQGSLSLKQMLRALFRSKLLLFSVSMGGMLIGGILAVAEPDSYSSKASFLVVPGVESLQADPLLEEHPQDGGLALRENAEAILLSEELFRRVVERVGPETILASYNPRVPQDAEDRLLTRMRSAFYQVQRWYHGQAAGKVSERDARMCLAESIRVETPQRSNLLRVSYTAHSPELAQEVLEAYMQEARSEHMEAYRSRDLASMAEEKLRSARDFHDKAREKLEGFWERHGIHDFEYELTMAGDEARHVRIELDAARTRAEANDLTSRSLRDRLAQMPSTRVVQGPVTGPDPRIAMLEEMVQRQENRLRQLSRRYKEEDAQIVDARHLLELLQEELATGRIKPDTVQMRSRTIEDETYLATKHRIEELTDELLVNQEAVKRLSARFDKADKRLRNYVGLRELYQTLRQDVLEARNELAEAERATKRARLADTLAKSFVSSLNVLEPPSLPIVKDGPDRGNMLLAGFLIGLFLALVLVFLRAMSDTRVHAFEDLEQRLLGIKVLASIPNLDRRNLRKHRKLKLAR